MRLLDMIDEPLLVVDAEQLRVRAANAAALELLDGRQIVDTAVVDLVPVVGERDAFAEMLRRAAAGAAPGGEHVLLTVLDGAGREVPAACVVRKIGSEIAHDALVVHLRIADRPHDDATVMALAGAHEQLAIADDRERIARDLHDNVIQRLFAAGISLQSALGQPDQDDRTNRVIDDLDDVMREIRSTIFALHDRPALGGLETAVTSLVDDSARVLGHRPKLTIEGDMTDVPATLHPDIIATLRELLSNVAKHAHATRADVRVSVGAEHLTVVVDDDGVGPQRGSTTGLGIANICDRAERRAGRAEVSARDGGGTRAVLTLPLHPPTAP